MVDPGLALGGLCLIGGFIVASGAYYKYNEFCLILLANGINSGNLQNTIIGSLGLIVPNYMLWRMNLKNKRGD